MVAVRGENPTLLKWYIAAELTNLRKRRGLTQQDVASRLGRKRMSVTQWEGAVTLPQAAEIEVLFEYLDASERTDDFLTLLSAAREGKDWWEPFTNAVPEWFDLFLGLESGASHIHSYDSHVIPGLFQTEEYAEAVFRTGKFSEEDIERRTKLRMARQEVITRQPAPPEIWSVLDESVLDRIAGSRTIMHAQLEHLTNLAQLPNVTVQVLPLISGPNIGAYGTFILLEFQRFTGSPTVAYDDRLTRGSYFEDPNDIQRHRDALARLQKAALDPAQSLKMINRRAKELLS